VPQLQDIIERRCVKWSQGIKWKYSTVCKW